MIVYVDREFNLSVSFISHCKIRDGCFSCQYVTCENGFEPFHFRGLSCDQLVSEKIYLEIICPHCEKAHYAGRDKLPERCGLRIFLIGVKRDVVVFFCKCDHLIFFYRNGLNVCGHSNVKFFEIHFVSFVCCQIHS